MVKLCLVLPGVCLLFNLKSHQNIESLHLNFLLLTMKENVTANQENVFKVLAFSSYALEKLKCLKFLLSNSKFKKIVAFSIYILRKLKTTF